MQFRVGKFQARVPSWLAPAIGYAISVASLIWFLQGVDFKTVMQDFQSLRWGWVAIAVVSDIAVYVFQAWRWNVLLGPVVRVPLWRSVQAIYVGLFTNEVFPLRPGEVIRSYLQARWSAIPFSVALSSAVIERVFDGIWLMLLFAATTLFVPYPRVVVELGKGVGAVVVIVALLLGLVMFWKHHAHAACPKTRWGAKLRVLIDDLHLMGNSRSFYVAFAASTIYLLIQVVPIYALMRGYDLDLTMWPALVVLVVLRIGTAIPQAPGNVGPSQVLMVLALGLFGIDKTTATGLSLMTWCVITLPLLTAGAIALAVTGLNLAEIRHHAHRHARAPMAIAETTSSQS
ncbi:MAG: lysylphosphatidylglycerol synthase transmembrane domain-containing protein [Rhodospirillales bacterium]